MSRDVGKPTPFTVVFWNVWGYNLSRPHRHGLLPRKLDSIVSMYNPDAIGLNEVFATNEGTVGILIDHLRQHGYHVHFAPFGPERGGQYNGSLLATKQAPREVTDIDLGPNKVALVRLGEAGHTVKAITAKLPLKNGGEVNLVVSHLAHLVPYNWGVHYAHYRALRQVLAASHLQSRTIMGGDFNEFKFMPRLWHDRAGFHRATGNFLRPTWRLGGIVPLFQANYDNIFWTKCGQIKLEEFKVLPRWPSHHSPLLGRFLIRAD